MKGLCVAALVLACTGAAATAAAHPVPFSYLDIRVLGGAPGVIDVTLVAHIFDVAHDLGIDPAERLLDPAVLQAQASMIAALFDGRLRIEADGRPLAGTWSAPEGLPDRNSVQRRGRFNVTQSPATLVVTAGLFPYDPAHQTFVNFYEHDAIASQVILDQGHPRFEYFTGSPRGLLAVARRFVWDGVRHMLTGPDHLVFLIGLLLLGGTRRRLFVVVTAFTLAHAVSLSLAAFGVFSPRSRLIEPAIALVIVYVGVDNLLVRDGRDMRAWIAVVFGLIHGFGFANVLRAMELSRRALGWSLVSLHVGLEISQLFLVVGIAGSLAVVKSRSEWAGRQLAVAGSVGVMAAGTFWFIQRVFFPGGIS